MAVVRRSCRGSFRDFVEQALGFLLQGEDVGADLGEGAELWWLIEMAGEADFVADLGVGFDPRRRCPWSDCRGRAGRPPGGG